MSTTNFHKTPNNVESTSASDVLNNTTTPLTFSVQPGDGARFASAGTPVFVTIYDKTTYPTNPFLDAAMEIADCTGVSGDALTINRPNPHAHTGQPTVAVMDVGGVITELQVAINALEARGADVFGEVPSGAINGSNVTFALAHTPVTGSLKLWLGMLRMRAPDDYSLSGSTITLVAAPLTGETPPLADYRY